MNFLAEENYVKVLGRTRMIEGIRYLDYSCSAIEFLFTGKIVQAILWTDSVGFEEHLKAWVAVFIDDEEVPSKRFPLLKTEDTYTLYEGAKEKETKLRLVKYSEAAFGKVGVKNIIIDSEKPPTPTTAKAKKLEFIGDSITCGYGNEGIWNTDTFNTTQENPWEAYAAKTARALDADYHLISWSGIGILSNWTDLEVPNDDWLMSCLYPYTDKAIDLKLGNPEPEVWDSARYVPDCIIINLGTNDNSFTRGIAEREETFGTRYYSFMKQVRSINPNSTILCTLGVMGQELCGQIKNQVERLVAEGDDKIHEMVFDMQSVKDGIGSDWHPSKTTHDKMTVKLEGSIREIMGW